MYKNNCRFSSKLKGCSPLQLSCNLTGKCHAVGYYSYTQRCASESNQLGNSNRINFQEPIKLTQ